VDFFRRAVAADPQYALAYVGLAESLLNGLSLNRAPLEDVLAEVEPLVNRALTLSPTLPDALAVKGWMLTEQFKFAEALPLLTQAIVGNPNDAASHRFLGDLYDRRGDPRQALSHFSTAAGLDPLDFISHVFRCQELVDLGEYVDARTACDRARELEPTNLWGPLATSWIPRAQGNTAEALEWIDAARRLAPDEASLADQKINLLLTQGKFNEAREVFRELPADPGFFSLAREANLVLAQSGAAALKAWLIEHEAAKAAETGAELTELARLHFMANDAIAAHATLVHAQRILPLAAVDLFDGSQIRHAYSAALIHAAIELKGGGDTARAMQILHEFDQLLATYEKNGGTHFGLYSLRAESMGLQGKKAEAQAALEAAWEHGWRATWFAHRLPYLEGVEIPGPK
jgi:tetratricopeptide (TPR) repeat protein